MVSPESQSHYSSSTSTMAKQPLRFSNRASLCFGDGCLFLGGILMALLLLWSFSSFAYPSQNLASKPPPPECASTAAPPRDSEESGNFYDDPELSYSFERPIKGWDDKRREWLRQHPSLASSSGGRERVLLVTGSQPSPCKNKIGDHLLLRFFKNKVDYCRLHGCDVFYNNVLLQPQMVSYWAKYPIVRAAMLAHPEADWIWWVDSDALFTDMDFDLPLRSLQGLQPPLPRLDKPDRREKELDEYQRRRVPHPKLANGLWTSWMCGRGRSSTPPSLKQREARLRRGCLARFRR